MHLICLVPGHTKSGMYLKRYVEDSKHVIHIAVELVYHLYFWLGDMYSAVLNSQVPLHNVRFCRILTVVFERHLNPNTAFKHFVRDEYQIIYLCTVYHYTPAIHSGSTDRSTYCSNLKGNISYTVILFWCQDNDAVTHRHIKDIKDIIFFLASAHGYYLIMPLYK